jgi:histidinol phosphatase-like PHP family hydrolase
MEEKLNLYRESFNALAWQYMSHDRRKEQLEALYHMIDMERQHYEGSYRQTLDGLIGILDYVNGSTNTITHKGVKAAMRLAVSICNQAISDTKHFGYMLGTIRTWVEVPESEKAARLADPLDDIPF